MTSLRHQFRDCQHCLEGKGVCNGEVVGVTTPVAREVYVRCAPTALVGSVVEQAQKFYDCLPRLLEEHGAAMGDVFLERVFFQELHADYDAFFEVRNRAYEQAGITGERLPAANCLGQPPCRTDQAFELQLQAVASTDQSDVRVHSFPTTDYGAAAKIIEAGGFRHLYLVNVHGCDLKDAAARPFRQQSDIMFDRVDDLLRQHGTDFHHVLRTWCYLDEIDRDYDEFNASRNAFFQRLGVERLPASTGIRSGLHPAGALTAMNAYALLNPAGDGPEAAGIEVMHTPTLNEADEYGSAFSRGMKVALPDKTVLYISGTASVDEHGATVHQDDIRKQIDRMLVNVQELLKPQGASLADVTQVIVYLKSRENLSLFLESWGKWGLAGLPSTFVEAGVCRPDLLCELEAIAVVR